MFSCSVGLYKAVVVVLETVVEMDSATSLQNSRSAVFYTVDRATRADKDLETTVAPPDALRH